MFVNKAEQAKARIDCADIIDNNKPIKNMADDIDKHGNTRKLVTQCFALYNVAGHSGLQVEISYEVQDIDRLRQELVSVQEAYKRAEDEREEMRRKLVEVTRTRALDALDSMVASVKESLKIRRKAIEEAGLMKDVDKQMISKVRAEIKDERERLIRWEQDIRQQVMSRTEVGELETLIASIEGGDEFDV